MVNRKLCCGCGACAQACPKNCITMVPDAEGFLYPVVNKEICVQCGLCDAVCPVVTKQKTGTIYNAYVGHSLDDELRKESSSGGAFGTMAKWVLERQGVVFGAAFAEDFSVCHIKIDNTEALKKIRGSKYVQSEIADTYKEAKAVLTKGQPVLFSGTSCQIAGLRAYLKRDYENLYTVDVLCHGVPSPKVWQNYLRQQEKVLGDVISEVSFRDKCSGWNNYSVRITAKNGAQHLEPFRKDAFMRCFISNLSLRPSCYRCNFKGHQGVSDVMIADAWGIERWIPDRDDNKGTSMILIRTKKGQQLWDAVSNELHAQPVDSEGFLAENPVFWNPAEKHANRKKFFQKIDKQEPWCVLENLCPATFVDRILRKGKRGVRKILGVNKNK